MTTSNFSTTPKLWRPLQPGDTIDIIAPASASLKKENALLAITDTLKQWELVPRITQDIFGKDLLCANNDEQRFKELINALQNTTSKAIWCLRGGYGCTRLLPQLYNLTPTENCKLFIGMSDITSLHIFLQQKWQWATLHGPSARQIGLQTIHPDSITEIKKILLGEIKTIEFQNLIPLNKIATLNKTINTSIIGGNLSLVQTSIGTHWQIDSAKKILFLEEINERAYRVDRSLQHLMQAGVFANVAAIVLGDFIGGEEPNGTSLLDPILKRFAEQCNFPVLRYSGIGHGHQNRPLPFGIESLLKLGNPGSLTIKVPCSTANNA